MDNRWISFDRIIVALLKKMMFWEVEFVSFMSNSSVIGKCDNWQFSTPFSIQLVVLEDLQDQFQIKLQFWAVFSISKKLLLWHMVDT